MRSVRTTWLRWLASARRVTLCQRPPNGVSRRPTRMLALLAAAAAAAAAHSHVWRRFLFRVALLILPTLQDAAFLQMVRLTAQTKIHHIIAGGRSAAANCIGVTGGAARRGRSRRMNGDADEPARAVLRGQKDAKVEKTNIMILTQL